MPRIRPAAPTMADVDDGANAAYYPITLTETSLSVRQEEAARGPMHQFRKLGRVYVKIR